MEILGYILGVLVLVEFFHVGYLVAKIRGESRDQTRMLRIALGIVSGQGGIAGRIGIALSYMTPANPNGSVRIDGDEWDCRAAGQIDNLAKVRVTGFDGPRLIVERAP